MFKKFISILLAFAMLLAMLVSLSACNVTDKDKDDGRRVTDAASNRISMVTKRNRPKIDVPPGTWAVYWYLCGSDLETKWGCATEDLEEMMAVTLPANVTVVIETGGAKKWQNNFTDAKKLHRFVYAGGKLAKVDSQPLASMGDPNTFADFLEYCNDNYPAEKQMVLLWDHGGGSLMGMEVDELHNDDLLTLPEFRDAMEAVPAASGAYEAVGFDACLMATVDMVEILSGYARYMVASEEVEPGIGWDYTGMFAALAKDSSMDGAKLGKAICDSFYAACDLFSIAGEVTLSVVDITRADALLTAYKAVGDEALLKAVKEKQPYFSAFGRAARDAEMYGGGGFEMVDLGDLVDKAGDLLPQNGRALLRALEDCVVYQVKGPYRSRAGGLSCYYNLSGDPQSSAMYSAIGTNRPYAYYHEYATLGALSEEAQVYVNGAAQQAGEPEPVIEPLPQPQTLGLDNFPVTIGANGRWQLKLGMKLASNLAWVYVNLAWVEPESGLMAMFGTNRDLTANYMTGVFTENFDTNWGCIDEATTYMEPIAIAPGYTLFAVPVYLNGEEYTLHVGYTHRAGGLGEYEILGAWEDSSEDTLRGMPSKNFRQLQPGDLVEPIHYLMPVHEDGSRSIEPMAPQGITVTEDTKFYRRSTGNGYYALFFEMIDYAGNSYLSEQASFRVREGAIERLPNGIVPGTSEQPPGSVAGYYISSGTFHHDGRNEDFEFFTAIVDMDAYLKMADMLDLPYGSAGDQTEGGGYTVQIYSDTIDLGRYAGMQKVYLTGDYFAAETIYHRRDIVFRVTEIDEVW